MPPKANWIRTGGAIGDDSMEVQRAYNEGDAGVKEVLQDTPQQGADPNDGVMLPQQDGAEG